MAGSGSSSFASSIFGEIFLIYKVLFGGVFCFMEGCEVGHGVYLGWKEVSI